jgi:hypothetical protein
MAKANNIAASFQRQKPQIIQAQKTKYACTHPRRLFLARCDGHQGPIVDKLLNRLGVELLHSEINAKIKAIEKCTLSMAHKHWSAQRTHIAALEVFRFARRAMANF